MSGRSHYENISPFVPRASRRRGSRRSCLTSNGDDQQVLHESGWNQSKATEVKVQTQLPPAAQMRTRNGSNTVRNSCGTKTDFKEINGSHNRARRASLNSRPVSRLTPRARRASEAGAHTQSRRSPARSADMRAGRAAVPDAAQDFTNRSTPPAACCGAVRSITAR